MNKNMNDNMESLTGSFLVSTPQMPDPRFESQLIYICSHGVEGALGVIVNRPDSTVTLTQILREMNMGLPEEDLPSVYIGGPISLEAAFILYRSCDYCNDQCLEVTSDIALTREKEVLEAIGRGTGPKDYLFLLGYAGWEPGQLEGELQDNSWLVAPGDDRIIFDIPDDQKWQAAAQQYGIDIVTFNENVGYA